MGCYHSAQVADSEENVILRMHIRRFDYNAFDSQYMSVLHQYGLESANSHYNIVVKSALYIETPLPESISNLVVELLGHKTFMWT